MRTQEGAPELLLPIPAHFPPELVRLPHWLYSKLEWSAQKRKYSKPPYSPKTHQRTDATTTAEAGTVYEALEAARSHDGPAAVGFILVRDTVLESDHCGNAATGELDPRMRVLVDRLGTYAEWSVSGDGVHVWMLGEKPEDSACHWYFDGLKLEVYSRDRWVTVTGRRLEGTPATLKDRTDELAALWEECKPPEPPPRPLHRPTPTSDDRALIEQAIAAKNGDCFARLWRGDIGEYVSKGESGRHLADWHLCLRLAYWTGGDAERMDRLFRQSGLYRDKWDRPDGTCGTYGWRTIQKALGR